MIDQEDIHNQCLSEDPEERIKALEQLKNNFLLLPDKQQTWNDLHKLTSDKNSSVRSHAASALGFLFTHLPDKQQAWNNLHKMTTDEYYYVRYEAAFALGFAFTHVLDKQQAWNDLHKMTIDEDSNVRHRVAWAIDSVFSNVPDKQQAWNDLIKLANDEDSFVKSWATLYALGFAPRYALDSTFSDVPDKQQAWIDVVKLTTDKDCDVRSRAASALGSVFSLVPDKQQAWNNLIKLASDEDNYMRHSATAALGSVFSYVPDKQNAWNDLHKLTTDKNNSVRSKAVFALGSVFSHMPDKQKAWNDLHKLTCNEDSYVRSMATFALGFAFSHMPDIQRVWNDLHKLTCDEDWDVRSKAAFALGSAFSLVPDKQQAWNDLIKLTTDKNSDVRVYANYSLGKVSIFKASQAEREEDYKKELEKAIEFFEKASRESIWDNPSKFCLPFYQSFHIIIFQKQEKATEEIAEYLEKAKYAVSGSKSKELLLEAVENLANALKQVKNLQNLDLESKKCELNHYRKFCDRAAELMIETEETAPFATIAMRKGLPILDRNLKELLEEIQKKAKIACRESKGTDAEEIACAVSKEVQKWEIGSQEEMTQNIEGLIETFRMRMPHLPGYEHIFEEIEGIRNINDLTKQYKIISRLVGLIPIFSSMPDHVVQDIKEIKEKTTSTSNEVKYLQLSVDRLIESVSELQNPQEYLEVIQQNLEVVKSGIPEMKGKIDEVLFELYSPLSTDQKLKIAFPIIPALVSYEIETNVPKLVADKIDELKNLVLRFKKDK